MTGCFLEFGPLHVTVQPSRSQKSLSLCAAVDSVITGMKVGASDVLTEAGVHPDRFYFMQKRQAGMHQSKDIMTTPHCFSNYKISGNLL